MLWVSGFFKDRPSTSWLKGVHKLQTYDQKLFILGTSEISILKIFFNLEHLQNKQTVGIKVAFLLIEVGLSRV
jgi:hypothetical protein